MNLLGELTVIEVSLDIYATCDVLLRHNNLNHTCINSVLLYKQVELPIFHYKTYIFI